MPNYFDVDDRPQIAASARQPRISPMGYIEDAAMQVARAKDEGGTAAALGMAARAGVGFPVALAEAARPDINLGGARNAISTFFTGATPARAAAAPVAGARMAPNGGWISQEGGGMAPNGVASGAPTVAPPEVYQSVQVPQAAPTVGLTPPPPVVPGQLDAVRNELAQRKAQEAMDFQSRQQAVQGNANAAAAWTENQRASREASVANFRATNGADMVLAGDNGAYAGQRKAILDDAAAKRAGAISAAANLDKANAGQLGAPRNYIDEQGRLQTAQAASTVADSRVIEAGAAVTAAGARATEAGNRGVLDRAQAGLAKEQTAGIKLNNEQHQRVLTLASAMGGAKDKEEAQKYERQILALTGKTPEDWGAMHIAGAQRFENGLPVGKDADSVLIFNKRTGEKQLLGGAPSGNQGGPAPSAQSVELLKKNPTPEMRAQFDQTFGPGASVRVLGK